MEFGGGLLNRAWQHRLLCKKPWRRPLLFFCVVFKCLFWIEYLPRLCICKRQAYSVLFSSCNSCARRSADEMRSRCAIERSRAEAGVDVLAQLQVTGDPDRRMYQPTRTNQLQQTKQTKYEYQTNWTLVLVAVHLVESVCWRRSVGWSKMASCHLTGADKRKCQCNYYKAECKLLFEKDSVQVKCQFNLFIYKNKVSHQISHRFTQKNTLTLVFPPDMPLEPTALLAVCARDAVPWLLGRGEPGEGERRRLRAPRNLATLTMGSPVPDSSGKLGWMVGWHLMKHRTSLVELK